MVDGRRRRDGDEEVSLTARRHVTQNPPGGLADHLSGWVHTLDSHANIGDPPGKAIVEVSLDPWPSMRVRGVLHVEAKQPRLLSHTSLRHRDHRPEEPDDEQ